MKKSEKKKSLWKSKQLDQKTSWKSFNEIKIWCGDLKWKMISDKEMIVFGIPRLSWNKSHEKYKGLKEMDCLYRKTPEGILIIDLDHIKITG
jgi:hypothetical protein